MNSSECGYRVENWEKLTGIKKRSEIKIMKTQIELTGMEKIDEKMRKIHRGTEPIIKIM